MSAHLSVFQIENNLTILMAEKSREINPFNSLSRIFKILILRFRHFDNTAKSNKYLWNSIVLKKS